MHVHDATRGECTFLFRNQLGPKAINEDVVVEELKSRVANGKILRRFFFFFLLITFLSFVTLKASLLVFLSSLYFVP